MDHFDCLSDDSLPIRMPTLNFNMGQIIQVRKNLTARIKSLVQGTKYNADDQKKKFQALQQSKEEHQYKQNQNLLQGESQDEPYFQDQQKNYLGSHQQGSQGGSDLQNKHTDSLADQQLRKMYIETFIELQKALLLGTHGVGKSTIFKILTQNEQNNQTMNFPQTTDWSLGFILFDSPSFDMRSSFIGV